MQLLSMTKPMTSTSYFGQAVEITAKIPASTKNCASEYPTPSDGREMAARTTYMMLMHSIYANLCN